MPFLLEMKRLVSSRHHSPSSVLQMRQTTFPVSRIVIRSPLDPAGNGFSKLPESERAVFSLPDFYFLILTLSRVSFPGATR
jgi:hypothetical protein